jgi:hypothetical protein
LVDASEETVASIFMVVNPKMSHILVPASKLCDITVHHTISIILTAMRTSILLTFHYSKINMQASWRYFQEGKLCFDDHAHRF